MKKMINKLKTEDLQVKILFCLSILMLIVVLAPLFRISYYNFRSVDDYDYALNGEPVWEESHSVIKVLAAQAIYAVDYYFNWQGTLFGEWISTSFISIFSKNAYYMGTWFSLGGFVLAEILTFMVAFTRILHADIYRAGIVTTCCLSLQILLTPYPSEAYYWFCGAIFYTFIHALALLLVTVLILLYYSDMKWKTILLEICALLLTLAVASGNYVTPLTMWIIYVLSVFWVFYRKNSHKWLYVGNLAILTINFVIAVLAPGAQVRQNSTGIEPMSALGAIFLSLKEAAEYVCTNLIAPCIILGLLFLPLFVNIVKKSEYRYPLPFLVSVISFGLFAAQLTPTLYSLKILGAGRIQNLYRFNYYVLIFGNELYWTGWLVKRWLGKHGSGEEGQPSEKLCYLLPGWCLGGMFLCVSLLLWGGSTLTTLSAMEALRDGTAQQYWAENKERLKLLEDESLTEVYLEPFTYKPYILYFGDIQPDPEDWVNKCVAKYFGKDAVYLRQE